MELIEAPITEPGPALHIRSQLVEGIRFFPYLDGPIMQARQARRSDGLLYPEGSLIVSSFANTEAVDYFDTIIDLQAVVNAWPGYMANLATLADGAQVRQGAVRYCHDPHRPVGFCREYEFIDGKGVLCRDVIPPSKSDVQQEVLDGILTGTSIGFDLLPNGYREDTTTGKRRVRFTGIKIPERSLTDAPATPGCEFSEMMARAKSALGISKQFFIPAAQSETSPELTRAVEPSGSEPESTEPEVAAPESEVSMIQFTWTEKDGWHLIEVRPESDFMEGTLRYTGEGADGVIERIGTLLEAKRQPLDEWGYQELSGVQAVGFNIAMWTTEAAEMYLKRDTWRLRRIEKEMAFSAGTLTETSEVMVRAKTVAPKPTFLQRVVAAFQRAKAEAPDQEAILTPGATPEVTAPPAINDPPSDEAALHELMSGLQATICETVGVAIGPAISAAVDPMTARLDALDARINELTATVAEYGERSRQAQEELRRLGALPQGSVQTPPTPPQPKLIPLI